MRKFEEVARASAKEQGLPVEVEINTENDFRLGLSTNLPNHSESMKGHANFVTSRTPNKLTLFRTKQSAYRYVAWLLCFANALPDEEGQEGVTFEQVREAVRDKGSF